MIAMLHLAKHAFIAPDRLLRICMTQHCCLLQSQAGLEQQRAALAAQLQAREAELQVLRRSCQVRPLAVEDTEREHPGCQS